MSSIADQLTLVKHALDDVLHRLSGSTPSPEVDLLRAKAQEFHRQAEDWRQESPTGDERERLMRRVLSLYVAAAKLERARVS